MAITAKQKKIIGGAIGAVVLAGGVFYAGMAVGKGATPARGAGAGGQFGGTSAGNMRRTANGGFVSGQIIAKDATSITVKTQNGSTKIILLSPTTQVMKSTAGTIDDLAEGTNIIATGAAQADGSVAAQSVQIRPAGASGMGGTHGASAPSGQ